MVALARELGKAVRYVETRSETMLEMQHGRAQVQDVEIGGTRDGKLTGLKVRVIADCGAYPADAALMPMLTGLMSCGVYTFPKVDFHFDAVVTNTTPIGAYRGAGRPEATALVERAIDMYAAEIGMDPAEVRRKNFITEFPHQTVTGANYDSGEYLGALDKCLANAGYEELRAQQKARRDRGDVVQLGLGICSYVEWTGFGSELGTCEVHEDGKVTVTAGTSSHGQGHETAYAQIVAGTLGDPAGRRQGHPVRHQAGQARHGHDGLALAAGRRHRGPARDRRGAREGQEARRAACSRPTARDIQVVPGQGLGVAGLARVGDPVGAARGRGLRGRRRRWRPRTTSRRRTPRTRSGRTWPSSRSTPRPGLTNLIRHITVDDSGRIHNELLLEGQVHGGIAQGVAQALYEEIAFDEDGNNVTGSLASYAIPSSSDLPSFETVRTQTPSPRNPLGAKGVGESGRDRLHAGRLERGHRRDLAPRRQEHRHAGDAAARLEGDQRRRVISSSARGERVDVAERGAEPDARPDRSGQVGLAPRAQLGVQAPRLGLGHVQQARDQRVRAEAAVADADRVVGAQLRGEVLGAVAVEREAGHADAVLVAGPERELGQPGDRRQPRRGGALESARSRSATASMPSFISASQAAAKATAPITLGEPASKRSGASAQTTSSSVTSLIAPPPCSSGSPSSGTRLTSAPAPNGA